MPWSRNFIFGSCNASDPLAVLCSYLFRESHFQRRMIQFRLNSSPLFLNHEMRCWVDHIGFFHLQIPHYLILCQFSLRTAPSCSATHFYSTRAHLYSIEQRGSEYGHEAEEAKQKRLTDGNDPSSYTLRNKIF